MWILSAIVSVIAVHRFFFSLLYCNSCVVYPHTYTNISGNIIKDDLRTLMDERTHLFIEICISHTLFSMFLWCVGDGWRQEQTAILTQLLLLTIASCVIFKNPLRTSSASRLKLFKKNKKKFSQYSMTFCFSFSRTFEFHKLNCLEWIIGH